MGLLDTPAEYATPDQVKRGTQSGLACISHPVQVLLEWEEAKWGTVSRRWPYTYEAPMCQSRETTPTSGFLLFFPPSGSWHRQQTVWCSDVIAVCRRSSYVAAPHTSWRFSRRLRRRVQKRVSRSALRPSTFSVPSNCLLSNSSGSTRRVVQCELGAGEEPHPQAVGDKRRFKPARERMARSKWHAQGLGTS